MNLWHRVDPKQIGSEKFLACIEISKGSKNKYELDKYSGTLKLDRILFTSTHYPQNYGFIPLTYADDGDPLDVLVLCSEEVMPLALVECAPIGVLEMVDGGKSDMKIIAVALNDPFYCNYKDMKELPEHVILEIKHFFKVYKELENKQTMVNSIRGRSKAIDVIQESINAYGEKFGNMYRGMS